MSPSAFDDLRDSCPEQPGLIAALRRQLATTLSADVHAVIDDDILVQQLAADKRLVHELLVTLVKLEVLKTLLLWKCPNGGGTFQEAENISDFPPALACDRCGNLHTFSSEDIDVCFQSTDRLLRELRLVR